MLKRLKLTRLSRNQGSIHDVLMPTAMVNFARSMRGKKILVRSCADVDDVFELEKELPVRPLNYALRDTIQESISVPDNIK